MARPPKPKPPHKMMIALNSLRNTTISVADNKFYYEVVTRYWHPNTTRIIKHDFETRELEPLAEIEGIRTKEPRVRFVNGEKNEWMSAADFVKLDQDKVGGTFSTDAGVDFRWKIHKGQLQLIRADDAEEKPLVTFHPHRRHFWVFRMSKHAYLEIKPEPEVIEALDRLVVSYLLVERQRRNKSIKVVRYVS
ncbi:uncharacterized protein C8Q71DRAFT_493509 [Rhodofomes roseus]|uniref:DUF6593 domain-containing protein n=1 Tax=Rhodofomes roseus TaxID=34475 RepID=A0A4Y9Y7D3_9APHY|nr:uncharacterized protein C8Q71DRAFT_493509 [Rhodofomes roseus]KAH9839061.1 hypothetical protein C8Q71DRAFT_493509 [Rhodofomes roseus]TFY57467.1 hypothetical protein EVJ58_g7002 [Rhodofomes roseus]